MAQFIAGGPSSSASAAPHARAPPSSSAPMGARGAGGPPRSEVQLLLGQFDAKINDMKDYPAKDVINSLTMLAEQVQFAPEIAPPNYKLPIFYLTDSILKNVKGPYISLLSRNIVPLYCNCVKQVSGKDLRRFVHVLNTGLRFKENAKLNAHLDFLFQYNRAQKERGKGGVSRSWYPDEDLWVSDFSGDTAPRETTSSSFFDRKEAAEEQVESYEDSHVPVDESITRCRICGENFSKSWDEEEEDWVYTNAVYGAIHDPNAQKSEKSIFHKFCYETVMANSKHVTPEHLIPITPQGDKSAAGSFTDDSADHGTIKRRLDEAEYDDDDSDDEDDIKRIKTE
ncbi:hypothetical protein ATCC90586_006388 [Pythium insidiosum]|nr:hypothetical protein ATCC90586_006388 [Pythium insidiosum]